MKEISPLGKLAVDMGFISRKQLENVLNKQKDSSQNTPLGELLLEEGLITSDQLLNLLKLQEVEIEKIPKIKNLHREAKIIAQLIRKNKFMEEVELEEKLKEFNSYMSPDKTFLEYLVEEKCLDGDQLREILSRYKTAVMYCDQCKKKFKVLSVRDSKLIQCPKCRGFLSVKEVHGAESGQTSFYSTWVFKNIVNTISKRKTKTKCPVCMSEFEAIPNKDNTLTCINCGTTITLKR